MGVCPVTQSYWWSMIDKQIFYPELFESNDDSAIQTENSVENIVG